MSAEHAPHQSEMCQNQTNSLEKNNETDAATNSTTRLRGPAVSHPTKRKIVWLCGRASENQRKTRNLDYYWHARGMGLPDNDAKTGRLVCQSAQRRLPRTCASASHVSSASSSRLSERDPAAGMYWHVCATNCSATAISFGRPFPPLPFLRLVALSALEEKHKTEMSFSLQPRPHTTESTST